MPPHWPQILRALHPVPHLIVGARALAHHGITRPTRDLDILASPDADIQPLLAPFIDTAEIPFAKASQGILIRIGSPFCDITTKITGVTFPEAWASRSPGTFAGIPTHFLGWHALLVNKSAASRPKDRADLELLLAAEVSRLRGFSQMGG